MMKLSYSTLAAPDWPLGSLLATAADLGYNGIELRGIGTEMRADRIPAFLPDKIDETMAAFAVRSLEIPILTAGAYFAGNPDPAAAAEEVRAYIALAAKLKTPYIRVMGEPTPAPVEGGSFDAAAVAAALAPLCREADASGVTLLVETNGVLSDSRRMLELLGELKDAPVGVLWDLHHTVRFGGEEPVLTVARLGRYIRHTHIKDSVKGSNGKITYMLNGYGDIPIEQAVRELKAVGYDGYLSYEWVKRWSRELAEPGVALYSYLSFMQDVLDAV